MDDLFLEEELDTNWWELIHEMNLDPGKEYFLQKFPYSEDPHPKLDS